MHQAMRYVPIFLPSFTHFRVYCTPRKINCEPCQIKNIFDCNFFFRIDLALNRISFDVTESKKCNYLQSKCCGLT